MKINLISVGSLEKKFLDLYNSYISKLPSNVNLNVIEIKERKDNNTQLKKEKETELILERIPKNSTVYLFSLKGKFYDSVKFSSFLNEDNITFIIGGSDGVIEEKFNFATKIKVSDFTFPHQLFKVLVAEQIYRGFSIINNKKYHK
ncbi:23S rRNA (pseudouridine(1915)-N(3))-methyltransferase RlmH [Mycoplasmopsis alligatoris]|uniref:Ribosomal RNA large subunit methyltransferase H n=1 Tax=Mycoplasmopsis alligatoris A21JP2 TaxID=747682 RepID=D4XW40_9BACT|nr:23S rRNA (pseudouridine(1915)-N(3))-methyltransferase RlmH [Mycoplasmopsis alligatoris]EFF41431.1 putative rRNA large subunit m3Psi methyltransferase RlmH [Mycoplasmopsis alligatoris A21JP2]